MWENAVETVRGRGPGSSLLAWLSFQSEVLSLVVELPLVSQC